jgi:hypothetical protein
MGSTDNYTIPSGPFGLCSGYWDEKSDSFISSDITEVGNCCLRACKPFVDECVKSCPEAENKYRNLCYESCSDIREACEDNCELNNELWYIDNPIFIGTREVGCGDDLYKTIVKECAIKNKNKIINICKKNCTPNSYINCRQLCEYSFDMITDKKNNPLFFKQPQSIPQKLQKIKNTNNDVNDVNSVIYAVGIVSIIFGIYIILKK